MKNLSYAIIFLFLVNVNAQTGTIKGKVVDRQSNMALEGVTVELLDQAQPKGVVTDADGYYQLKDVPVGRQRIRFSYLGYESFTVPNIIVSTGKDAVSDFALLETFDELDEVVVTSSGAKERPINTLSTVSTRQFGVEEVQRFSGGRSDVGRLAANFAGVSAPDDSRNDIVVRGNSPTGLLWRLEGIPIPSPNHFGTTGTTGSPVSALNPNMIKNSDFLTSAFAAEYGNALGGVFDLGFRKGNADDYEYMGQVGAFTGLELMAEGPWGTKKGSFLVAARYSVIGLIGGGSGTSAVPNYSDLSFNLDFGNRSWGTLSLFGIVGTSDIDFLGNDIDEDDLFAAEDENLFTESGFSVVGLKHQINIGNNSYLKTVVSGSSNSNNTDVDRFIEKDTPQERIIRFTENEDSESRFSFSTLFNSKLSKRATIRAGALVENFGVDLLQRDRSEQPDLDGDGDSDLVTFVEVDDNLSIVQPYVQTQLRITEKLKLNAGVHGQYGSLNEQFVIEPRAGLQYSAGKSTFSVGYGVHHQNVPFPLLFLNENVGGELVQTNRDLDFVRSNHYVLGYDLNFGNDWRIKTEVYYQAIENAAVEPFPSSYSSLSEGADFGFSTDRTSLVNEGTGFNQGIEFTLEKFFSKGYYGLLTGSFYESKYEGSDGIERNSPFNNGRVVNLLAGKEFKMGKTGKNVLSIDTRITTAGGRYFTPIDLEASRNAGFQVDQEELAFSEQADDYFRFDLKFGYKINHRSKKRSHQFYVDIQNLTNNENEFVRRYNRLTNNVDVVDQIGLFPDFGYRFQF